MRSLVFFSALGVVLALTPLPLCFVLAGYGHGTVIPFVVFYSPSCVLLRPFDTPVGAGTANLVAFIGLFVTSAAFFYALYANIMAVGRRGGFGTASLFLVFGIHYLSLAVSVALHNWEEDKFVQVLRESPLLVVAAALVFAAYNFAAVASAKRKIPRFHAPDSESG